MTVDPATGESRNFWKTFPGVITAISGFISAVGGLLITLHSLGLLGSPATVPSTDSRSVTERISGPGQQDITTTLPARGSGDRATPNKPLQQTVAVDGLKEVAADAPTEARERTLIAPEAEEQKPGLSEGSQSGGSASGAQQHDVSPGGIGGGVVGGVGGGVMGGVIASSPGGAQEEDTPVYLTGDVRPPERTAFVKPIYPEDARLARTEGKVILEVVVSRTGSVVATKLLKSNPLFGKAAIEAVRQWQYRPALRNGRPVSVYLTVIVEFTLK